MTASLKTVIDNLSQVVAAVRALTREDVLVGVPGDDNARDTPIGNAALAYIHDNGAPEAHVPARPFMVPGIESVRDEIIARQSQMAVFALEGQMDKVDQAKHALGLRVSSAIKAQIQSNIPPPLSPNTIRNRHRQRGTGMRKGERQYLAQVAAGTSPAQAQTNAGIVALVNTGQLRNSITYVIRKS